MTKKPKPSEVLRRARDRISDINHWTTKAFARDAGGNSVPLGSSSATQWCAVGAIRAERPDDIGSVIKYLKYAGMMKFITPIIINVNDLMGHRAVMKMYDKAIELAEAEGN